jgi:AcrR family transcriptional regulator
MLGPRDPPRDRHVGSIARDGYGGSGTLTTSEESTDRRALRRASRQADSRTEIIDAAEKVFGEVGIRDGSVRKIAAQSGFSSAAIYLYFENKQQLLADTMKRRGDEFSAMLRVAGDSDLTPLGKLHRIVDDTLEFFTHRPHFRQMMRHLRGAELITGAVLGDLAAETNVGFNEVMAFLAGLVRDGQAAGEIRDGDARALAHLYSVLNNEFVLLTTSDISRAGSLTSAEFHAIVDGVLRKPAPAPKRPTKPSPRKA